MFEYTWLVMEIIYSLHVFEMPYGYIFLQFGNSHIICNMWDEIQITSVKEYAHECYNFAEEENCDNLSVFMRY